MDKLESPLSRWTQHRTQSQFGDAVLEDHLGRPGVGFSGLQTGNCIGRFAAMDDCWTYETVTGVARGDTPADPLESLNHAFEETKRTFPKAGMIGYIAYEAGFRWLNLKPRRADGDPFALPLVQFLVFDELVRGAKLPTRSSPSVAGDPFFPDQYHRLLESPHVRRTVDRSDYLSAVRQIKRHISDGDIYQANYTQAFDIESPLSGREIYGMLARSNPAPFAAHLHFAPVRMGDSDRGPRIAFPTVEVISSSPERFWKKRGEFVETRPIKGTIARGVTPAEDRLLRRRLVASGKDRAELLMITDLERNDLGVFADIGSVQVEALRRIRGFASVWHLESIVTARAPESTGWEQIMRCMFPGGSITGAPKRRAVTILRELENVPRGVYCGAIGWIDSRGNADFSVAIRTMVKMGSRVRVYGGGGIVADSDPDAEYEESLIKVAPILRCLIRE